jgi:tRNA uridine 5-carboxymethylaminomethyl modification enzyme
MATPNKLKEYGISISLDGVARSAFKLLSYPDISLESLSVMWPELGDITKDVAMALVTEAKYSFYLLKQEEDIRLFKQYEDLKIPIDTNYSSIESLSNEVREKLGIARPSNIGAAGRVPGITPAAVMALIVFLRKEYGL